MTSTDSSTSVDRQTDGYLRTELPTAMASMSSRADPE